METRKLQLRAAKRRQRSKDMQAGQTLYQVKLPAGLSDRLKNGMKNTSFVARFHEFLEHELIRVDVYPNLALLCWNQDVQYITREDSFRLYERNWRLLDTENLTTHEEVLVNELKHEFGRGLINA